MYKKSVLWTLTGIKCKERPSKTYLEKEKDLRFEREQLRWSLLTTALPKKCGKKTEKEFDSDLRSWGGGWMVMYGYRFKGNKK